MGRNIFFAVGIKRIGIFIQFRRWVMHMFGRCDNIIQSQFVFYNETVKCLDRISKFDTGDRVP